jgi:tRNA threonylcarbamoyladenosine biosynthesis protein TsaE
MLTTTNSAAETRALGEKFAETLAPGDTVVLEGQLGAGKSEFTRGIARGLGIDGPMPSPTFTLMIPYESEKGKLYHFDLYRLSDPDEYYAAGLDEFVGGDGVAVVEWPQMAELSPEPALMVRMSRDGDEECRRIEIENRGVAGYDPEKLNGWRNANG